MIFICNRPIAITESVIANFMPIIIYTEKREIEKYLSIYSDQAIMTNILYIR